MPRLRAPGNEKSKTLPSSVLCATAAAGITRNQPANAARTSVMFITLPCRLQTLRQFQNPQAELPAHFLEFLPPALAWKPTQRLLHIPQRLPSENLRLVQVDGGG